MNILYYSWNSQCDRDGIEGLEKIGAKVTISNDKFDSYDEDEKFIAAILVAARNANAEAIFSFNYFPDLSRTAMMLQIPYVSWVYDSPHLTLESLTLNNPVNHVFVFDFALAQKYAAQGIETVEYLPLACNVDRLEKICHDKYAHEITFLGRTYDDDQNFFAQIKYLPDSLKGYLDAVIAAQKKVYGMNMAEKLLTPAIYKELKQYIKAELGPKYNDSGDHILQNMILKETTVQERRDFLTMIGEKFPGKLDHYAPVKSSSIPANFCGYADYYSEMPRIFYTSKINLNITLRSITTGIPLRIIDILGAGGFCLTNFQAELAEYFENGVDLVWFESPEDMLEKIAYYLEHEDEREAIAKNGHEKVKELFTYEKQLGKIFA